MRLAAVLSLLCVGLAAAAFASDENLTCERGALEVATAFRNDDFGILKGVNREFYVGRGGSQKLVSVFCLDHTKARTKHTDATLKKRSGETVQVYITRVTQAVCGTAKGKLTAKYAATRKACQSKYGVKKEGIRSTMNSAKQLQKDMQKALRKADKVTQQAKREAEHDAKAQARTADARKKFVAKAALGIKHKDSIAGATNVQNALKPSVSKATKMSSRGIDTTKDTPSKKMQVPVPKVVAKAAAKQVVAAKPVTKNAGPKHSGKSPKCPFDAKSTLSLKTIPKLAACMAAEEPIKFTAALKFGDANVPAKFLTKLFPGGFPLEIEVTPLPDPELKACAALGSGVKLAKNLKLSAPKFCMTLEKGEEEVVRLGESNQNAVATTGRDQNAVAIAGRTAAVPAIDVTLEVESGLEFKIGKDKLTLGAKLSIEPTMIRLSGTLSGLWFNPLGIKGLTIGNLNLEVGFTAAVPSFLAFGGKLGIGSGCKAALATPPKPGKCVHGYMYMGVGAGENYIAASISKLRLIDILTWITLGKVNLSKVSKVLSVVGFPKGVSFAFSDDDVDLPGGFSIPQGISFAATVQILGYSGSMAMEVDLENAALKLEATVNPIHLGGIARLQRSKTDKRGPLINVNYKFFFISLDIAGYIEILGIGAETKVVFDMMKGLYYFVIEGPLFASLFTARVEFKATFGNPSKSKVSFLAQIMPGPLGKLVTQIISKVKSAVTKAMKHLKKLYDELKKIAKKVGIRVEERTAELEWFERYADLGEGDFWQCAKSSCRDGHVPPARTFGVGQAEMNLRLGDGISHRAKIRKGKALNVKKVAKKAGKSVSKVAKKAGKSVSKAANKAADEAKKAADAAKKAAMKEFNNLKATYEKAKNAAKGFVDLAKDIARDPFSVLSFCGASFSAQLSAKQLPKADVAAQLIIRGKRTEAKLAIDFGNIPKTVRGMFNPLFKIIKALFRSGSRGKDKCNFKFKSVTDAAQKPLKKRNLPKPDQVKAQQKQPKMTSALR